MSRQHHEPRKSRSRPILVARKIARFLVFDLTPAFLPVLIAWVPADHNLAQAHRELIFTVFGLCFVAVKHTRRRLAGNRREGSVLIAETIEVGALAALIISAMLLGRGFPPGQAESLLTAHPHLIDLQIGMAGALFVSIVLLIIFSE